MHRLHTYIWIWNTLAKTKPKQSKNKIGTKVIKLKIKPGGKKFKLWIYKNTAIMKHYVVKNAIKHNVSRETLCNKGLKNILIHKKCATKGCFINHPKWKNRNDKRKHYTHKFIRWKCVFKLMFHVKHQYV